MIGGAGNDIYVVDSASDIVTEAASAGTDTVQSSATYTLSANVENLTLTGTSEIDAIGNALANILKGNTGDNVLVGGGGGDTLDGGEGEDVMMGGTGNDTYIIDNIGDVVAEKRLAGIDTIKSSITYTLSANIENLTLTGTAAINGTGNTLSNVLTGNSAANTLNGGAGNDLIIGGAGKDTLTGSTGVDKFIYASVSDSSAGSTVRDVITDFQGSTGERIDLFAIDAFTGATGNQQFAYIGTNSFTGTKGEVRFSGGVLQMNTGTDKIADMEIALTGVTAFQSTFLIL
jgi:Ca2+-binding RTX toxin-like protein